MTNLTVLQIIKEKISQLSDDELKSVSATVKLEQNERENKKRRELLKKTITALTELQFACPCITIGCSDCGCDICLSMDELVDKIKEEIEYI